MVTSAPGTVVGSEGARGKPLLIELKKKKVDQTPICLDLSPPLKSAGDFAYPEAAEDSNAALHSAVDLI